MQALKNFKDPVAIGFIKPDTVIRYSNMMEPFRQITGIAFYLVSRYFISMDAYLRVYIFSRELESVAKQVHKQLLELKAYQIEYR